MNTETEQKQLKNQFGTGTRLLATMCHHCNICPHADRRPDSNFGRLMRWHRGWCPAWAAHGKVYGRKPLS